METLGFVAEILDIGVIFQPFRDAARFNDREHNVIGVLWFGEIKDATELVVVEVAKVECALG